MASYGGASVPQPQHEDDGDYMDEENMHDEEDDEQHAMGGSLAAHGQTQSGGGHGFAGRRSWVRWTAQEHALLAQLVAKHGVNRSWSLIASHIPGRTGKQCRERWLNHTTPDSKRGGWAPNEEYVLAQQHSICGSQWCRISRSLPGRTDNSVKNHWNATWRSKVMHKPQSILWLYTTELKRGQSPANALRHALLQWEHNVPSHLVVETLGFWPSQQYASGASQAAGNDASGKLGGGATLGALAQAASLEQGATMEGVQLSLPRQPSSGAPQTTGAPPKPQPPPVPQQQAALQRLTLPVEMDTGAVACAATMVAMCGGGGQRSGSNNSDDSCMSKMTMQPGTPAVAVPPLPPHQHVHHHVVHHHHHHMANAAGQPPQQLRARRESGDSPHDAPPAGTGTPPTGDMRLPLPPAPILVVDPASLPTPAGGGNAFTSGVRHNNSGRPPHSPNTHSEQLSCGLAKRPSGSAGGGGGGSVPVPPPSAPLLEAAAAAEHNGLPRLARRPSHDSSTQSRPPAPPPQQQQRGGYPAAQHHPQHHQATSSQAPQLLVVPPTPPMMPGALLPAGALTPTSTVQQGPACSGMQPLQLVASSGQVMLASGAGAATPSPSVHQLEHLPLATAVTGSSSGVLHLGSSGAAIPVLPAGAQYLWQADGAAAAAMPLALPLPSAGSVAATQQVVWLAGPNGALTPHSVTFVEPPPQLVQPQQQQSVMLMAPPGGAGPAVVVPPPSAFAAASAHALPSHPSAPERGGPAAQHALAATHTADSVQLPPRASGGLAPRTSVSSMSALPAAHEPPHQHPHAPYANKQLPALGSSHTPPAGALLPPSGSSVASASAAQQQLMHQAQQQQQQLMPEADGAAAAQVLTLMMHGGQLVLGPAGGGSGADALPVAAMPEHAATGGGGGHRPSVAGDNFAGQAQTAAAAGGQNIKLVLSHNQQQQLLQALLAQQGISVVM